MARKSTKQPTHDELDGTSFAQRMEQQIRDTLDPNFQGFTWERAYERHPILLQSKVRAIISGRNLGKSTATIFQPWKEFGGWTPQKKGLILRNNDIQLKIAKTEFNHRFAGLMKIVGNQIFSLKETVWRNIETGEERREYTTDQHVGYVASVAQAINFKGAWTDRGVSFIIYEEFNQSDGITRNLYPDFINLLSTMVRINPDTVCYMLGNKDTFMSDFFVNWDITPKLNHDEDIVYEVWGTRKDGSPILDVVLLDVGNDWYNQLNVQDTLAYRLAQHNALTRQYLAGEYMMKTNPQVLNYKHLIENFNPRLVFMLEGEEWMLGDIDRGQAILSPWNAPQQNGMRKIALDNISRITDAVIPDPEELNELFGFILKGMRERTLYFDGYDGFNAFAEATTRWKMNTEWN